MSDKTLAALTAATPATGGLLYGTQGGADRKFTLTAAGAAMMEASSAIKLDELAAPTDVTTLNATTSAHGLLPKLGGGTANFLRADGTWAAPAGGGLVRGSGSLYSGTEPPVAATAPADLILEFGNYTSFDFNFELSVDDMMYDFTCSGTDPEDGTTWIDNSSFSTMADLLSAFQNAIEGLGLAGLAASNDFSSILTITDSNTGGDRSLSGAASGGAVSISISGGGAGTNFIPPPGAITEVIVIPAVTGKTTLPVRVMMSNDGGITGGVNVEISLRIGGPGGTYYGLGTAIAATTASAEWLAGVSPATIADAMPSWFSGVPSADLVARLIGDVAGDGGTVTVYAIAEQI